MKNYKKGFVPLVLLVIAVIVIGEGAYIYSKNKSVDKVTGTANMETEPTLTVEQSHTNKTTPTKSIGTNTNIFSSSQYGFEVDYPKEWTINTQYSSATSINFNEINSQYVLISITDPIKDKRGNIVSFEEHLKAYNYESNYVRGSKTLGGNLFLTFQARNERPGNGIIRYAIVRNGVLYEFVYSWQNNNKSILPAFEGILSTLRFTK
jgi:hypothetical protein